jgi:hypothetical protein
MKRIRATTSAAFAAILFSIPCAAQTSTAERTANDRLVYAAVLDSLFVRASAGRLIVARPTLARTRAASEPDNPPAEVFAAGEVEPSTAASFRAANTQPATITTIPVARVRIEVVPDSVFANFPRRERTSPPVTSQFRIPESPYWTAFYARFPDASGIIRFSRVGYSDDGREAAVAVSYSCGQLCGRGSIVVLEKRDGVWRVRSSRMNWVS